MPKKRAKKVAKVGTPIVFPPNPVEETKPEVKTEIDKDARRRLRTVQDDTRITPKETTAPDFDPVHQKLFEAPDGHFMVGEIGAKKVWYPKQGMWILPKRESLTADQVVARRKAQEQKK